jgi:hypothetical protein
MIYSTQCHVYLHAQHTPHALRLRAPTDNRGRGGSWTEREPPRTDRQQRRRRSPSRTEREPPRLRTDVPSWTEREPPWGGDRRSPFLGRTGTPVGWTRTEVPLRTEREPPWRAGGRGAPLGQKGNIRGSEADEVKFLGQLGDITFSVHCMCSWCACVCPCLPVLLDACVRLFSCTRFVHCSHACVYCAPGVWGISLVIVHCMCSWCACVCQCAPVLLDACMRLLGALALCTTCMLTCIVLLACCWSSEHTPQKYSIYCRDCRDSCRDCCFFVGTVGTLD